MINKYAALECVLYMRIQKIKLEIQKESEEYEQRVARLHRCSKQRQELLEQRNLCFLYRHNTEYFDSLLERLHTMRLSICQEHSLSKSSLDHLHHQLLSFISRRNTIKKIRLLRSCNHTTKG